MRSLLAGVLRSFRSVRARLIVWNICVLTLILAVLAGIVQYTVRTNLLASVDHELIARANLPDLRQPGPQQMMAGALEQPFFPSSLPPSLAPPQAPLSTREFARKSYWPRFLDTRGRSLFPVPGQGPWDETAFRAALRGWSGPSTVNVLDGPVRVFSRPIRNEGRIVAIFQMPYSLREVNRVIGDMNRTLLMLVPVALLLAGWCGTWLTDRALRPVREVVHTAERIGAHDLSRRLSVLGDDEFAHLALTINAMLSRLEIAFEQRGALVHQLENLVAQERRFTADASHELKTPLTIIKANTSLILRSAPTPEEYREAMEDVDRAADTMSRLVQDLLLLARYDERQLGRNRVPIRVADALITARQYVSVGDAPPISVEVGEGSPVIEGVPDEIARLFANLIDNAVKYTAVDGRVTARAGLRDDRVWVEIADTGIGIASEHLAHLGERFYRVESARSRGRGGTGLGLAICKSIAAAHDGSFAIQSAVGGGTTVTLTFPALSGSGQDFSPIEQDV